MKNKYDLTEFSTETLKIRLENLIKMKRYFECTNAIDTVLNDIEETKKELKKRKVDIYYLQKIEFVV